MIDIQSLFQDGINERVLVIGKTTVNISANQKDVDVLFERDGRRFMMLLSGLSEASINAKEYLFGKTVNIQLNKIAARWPAKAVAQFYFY